MVRFSGRIIVLLLFLKASITEDRFKLAPISTWAKLTELGRGETSA